MVFFELWYKINSKKILVFTLQCETIIFGAVWLVDDDMRVSRYVSATNFFYT